MIGFLKKAARFRRRDVGVEPIVGVGIHSLVPAADAGGATVAADADAEEEDADVDDATAAARRRRRRRSEKEEETQKVKSQSSIGFHFEKRPF